jgi:ligand-binding sensor domain-containing protein
VRIPRRATAVLGIAIVLSCLVAGGIWRTERALREARRKVAAGRDIAVTIRTFAAEPNPGFEALSAPANFRSAAVFNGRFYLAGPGGLFVYSNDGSLLHIFHPGADLPAAPLGQLATATLADSNGPELLVATSGEGVLAFDGRRFRQIRSAAPAARDITALLPLASGRLLLGTAKCGLLVFDGKSLQRFHPTTTNLYVTALAGTESDLWVGTLDRGVLHWSGGRAETISEANGLPDARVESVAVDGSTTYVATPTGVAEVHDGKVSRVLAPGTYAHAVLPDSDAIYVGQLDGGLLRVTDKTANGHGVFRRAIAAHFDAHSELHQGIDAPDRMDSPIEQLIRVGDARYAVKGNQLLRLEPSGEWREVLRAGGALLTDRNISALMVASDGRIWVGYFDRGIDILPPSGGQPAHIENAHVFCVNRILENPHQGTVAIATANGLILFDRDGGQKQVLTRDSGLIASHVTDVVLYGDGLVAGTPAGITFLDSSGSHSIYAFQGLINNHVYALGARDNGLLVGTLGGISLISEGAVRRNLNTGNSGLKANWTTALAQAGSDWIVGTYGAGLLRIGPDGIVSATEATVQGTVINPGAMASDGRLILAGTLGKGLLVGDVSGTRWKTITGGLPSLNVTALTIDKGVVYIGTDNGLVKIAEDKL